MKVLSFLAVHQLWRQETAKIMAERDAAVAHRLIKVAPMHLRAWIENHWQLEFLLQHGERAVEVDVVVDLPLYGFKSRAHFDKSMQALAERWAGLVDVTTDYEEEFYIKLKIVGVATTK